MIPDFDWQHYTKLITVVPYSAGQRCGRSTFCTADRAQKRNKDAITAAAAVANVKKNSIQSV